MLITGCADFSFLSISTAQDKLSLHCKNWLCLKKPDWRTVHASLLLTHELLLDHFSDLQVIHGVVKALDDLAVGWHALHLDPAWHKPCQFFNLSLALLLIDELTSIASLMQLFNKGVHLDCTCALHLVDVADLTGQACHRLVVLAVHLGIDILLSLLLMLNHLCFNFFDHSECVYGQASLSADLLKFFFCFLVSCTYLLFSFFACGFSHHLISLSFCKSILH